MEKQEPKELSPKKLIEMLASEENVSVLVVTKNVSGQVSVRWSNVPIETLSFFQTMMDMTIQNKIQQMLTPTPLDLAKLAQPAEGLPS